MIEKFRNDPSIIKKKEAMSKGSTFHFTASNEADILNKINNLNTKNKQHLITYQQSF